MTTRVRRTPGTVAGAQVAWVWLLALSAAGCAWVRPVTLKPQLPAPRAYVSDAAARSQAARAPALDATAEQAPNQEATSAVSTQTPHPDRPWWGAFADQTLSALIEEALRNNYFIRDLRNLIYENALEPTMPSGALWPLRIGLPLSAQHFANAAPPFRGTPGYTVTGNAADLGVAASYQLDVFGQLDVQRRTFEDRTEQQRQNTERFAQALAEQVTQLWFDVLEQRAERALLERQVGYSRDLLALVEARFEQHLVTRLVVLQQQQQLLATEAQLPQIEAGLALLNSKLTGLLGRTPAPNVDLVPEQRALPDLPRAPELGAPAELLQNSPDLRFAQARVAEAEHLTSENLASWLPTVELFGNAGMTSYELSQNLFTTSFGARLTWPIFDGGQRITRARQLTLTVQRRSWQYQSAFNDALQRVQDALIQERKQAEHLQMLRAELELAARVLAEARQLFEQGLSDYLPVLAALTNLTTLERTSLQARRLLLSHRIQLYHALGGTWSKAAT